jgi:hypothetical protein
MKNRIPAPAIAQPCVGQPWFFMYGDNKPHCWSGPVTTAERLKEMAQLVQRKRPAGATTPWWTY